MCICSIFSFLELFTVPTQPFILMRYRTKETMEWYWYDKHEWKCWNNNFPTFLLLKLKPTKYLYQYRRNIWIYLFFSNSYSILSTRYNISCIYEFQTNVPYPIYALNVCCIWSSQHTKKKQKWHQDFRTVPRVCVRGKSSTLIHIPLYPFNHTYIIWIKSKIAL